MDHFLYLIKCSRQSSKQGAIMALLILKHSKDTGDAIDRCGLAFGWHRLSVKAHTWTLPHSLGFLACPCQLLKVNCHKAQFRLCVYCRSLWSEQQQKLPRVKKAECILTFPAKATANLMLLWPVSTGLWQDSAGPGTALWGYQTFQGHLGSHRQSETGSQGKTSLASVWFQGSLSRTLLTDTQIKFE